MTQHQTQARLLASVRTAVRQYVNTHLHYKNGGTFHVIGVLSLKQDASRQWNVVNDNHVHFVAQGAVPDPSARNRLGVPPDAVVVEYLLRTMGDPLFNPIELVWEPDPDALERVLTQLTIRQAALQRKEHELMEQEQKAHHLQVWAQHELEWKREQAQRRRDRKEKARAAAAAWQAKKEERKTKAAATRAARKLAALQEDVTMSSILLDEHTTDRIIASNCRVMRKCCGSIPYGMSRYQVPKYNLEFYEGRSYRETPSYCWRQGRTAH